MSLEKHKKGKKAMAQLQNVTNIALKKRRQRLSHIMGDAQTEMEGIIERAYFGRRDESVINGYRPPSRSTTKINRVKAGMLGSDRHEEITDVLRSEWRNVLNAFYLFPPYSRDFPVVLYETPGLLDTYIYKVTVNLPENEGLGYGVKSKERKGIRVPDMIAWLPYCPPLVIEIGDCEPTKWPTSWWVHIHWDLTVGEHNRPCLIDNWWLLSGNFLQLSLEYCLCRRSYDGMSHNRHIIDTALHLIGRDEFAPLFRRNSDQLYHYGKHDHMFSSAVTYLLAHYHLHAVRGK